MYVLLHKVYDSCGKETALLRMSKSGLGTKLRSSPTLGAASEWAERAEAVGEHSYHKLYIGSVCLSIERRYVDY